MCDLIDELENGTNENLYLRDEIADLQVYQICGVTYSLPINSSPELRHMVAASIRAHIEKINFDTSYKLLSNCDFSNDEWLNNGLITNYLIANETDLLVNVMNDYFKKVNSDRNLTVGEFQFFVSMIRLRESFKSVIILCDRSLFIEMMPILRLIYEQLCWCCYVIDEKDEKNLNSNWTTKNTKHLKNKINEYYGRLYDFLSKESHMAPNQTEKYIEEITDTTFVTNARSNKKAKQDIPWIIECFHIYLQVFEYAVEKHFYYDVEYYKRYFDITKETINLMFKVHNDKEHRLTLDNDELL